ncbi:MAG TPA: tetratricopeptide repeat protein [Chryseolinea sp.]|nr:tetratricopeptide repeat protein [Chryseolinea sp.]
MMKMRAIYVCIFLLFTATVGFAQASADKRERVIARADSLMQHEDYAGALEIFNSLLEKSKLTSDEDYAMLYKRAYCFYGVGKFEEALNDINRFIEKNPDQQAKMLRAYINQELGNSTEQLKDLNELIDGKPENLDLTRWRASVLMELGKYKEARKDINQILSKEPNPDIMGYLGLTYYYEDDPDSALTIFDKIIASNPGHVQSYVYAASLALEQEIYPLALEYINKGLAADASNTTLMFYKGIALVETEKVDSGCRCLTKAFQAGVDDAGDYLKGFCYGVE